MGSVDVAVLNERDCCELLVVHSDKWISPIVAMYTQT